MCVCNWSPVREVFTNYEVVVFQPRTVTPPHLGSAAIVTLKLSLPPHLFLLFFWIFLLPPPSYLPPIHSRPFSKPFLIFTCCPFPLLAQSATHLDISYTRHPLASASRLFSPRFVPTSTAVPVTVHLSSLLSLACAQLPVIP